MRSLALRTRRHHIGVTMTEELREAIRRVLEEAPGSIRALAREAGVDHSTLLKERDGKRSVPEHRAADLAAALRRWAERCERLADSLDPEEEVPDG